MTKDKEPPKIVSLEQKRKQKEKAQKFKPLNKMGSPIDYLLRRIKETEKEQEHLKDRLIMILDDVDGRLEELENTVFTLNRINKNLVDELETSYQTMMDLNARLSILEYTLKNK